MLSPKPADGRQDRVGHGPAEPKRCYRVAKADTERSRRRGSRLGLAHRYALRSLPPIEEDEP